MSENRMGTVIQTAPQAQPWPPEQGQWTYEDWLHLPDDGFRYEVLNGVLYMTPPPRIRHQFTLENLSRRLGNFGRTQAGVDIVRPLRRASAGPAGAHSTGHLVCAGRAA